MVRLVFRPFTHIRRSICTSKSLRASTRVSSGFTLCTQSSPSFGSHHVCSNSVRIDIQRVDAAGQKTLAPFTFITHLGFCHPNTRIHVRLLGPCFKTGHRKPFRQHPERPTDGRASHATASNAHCPERQMYTSEQHGQPPTSLRAWSLVTSIQSVVCDTAVYNSSRVNLPSRMPFSDSPH